MSDNCINCGDSLLPGGSTVIISEAQQPSCDQCGDDSSVCEEKMDAKCVVYHLRDCSLPSHLTGLGLPSGCVDLETILESLETLVSNTLNIPLTASDTDSIDLTATGAANHTLKADLKVSGDAGNIVEIRGDGVYVPNNLGKLKIDASDSLDYLEDQVVGGSDGIVSLSIQNNGIGILEFKPTINTVALCNLVRDCVQTITGEPSMSVSCGDIIVEEDFVAGTASSGTVTIPVVVIGSGTVTVVINSDTGAIMGNLSQSVTSSTTELIVPITYDGTGGPATVTATISFFGTHNTITDCEFEIEVSELPCEPVEILGEPVLPDAYENVEYFYEINLSGDTPFTLSNVVKPSWMTIIVSGSTITIEGIPDTVGTNFDVSFTVHNSCSTDDFEDTIDVVGTESNSSITDNSSLDFTTYEIYVNGTLVQSDTVGSFQIDYFTYLPQPTNATVTVVLNYVGAPEPNPFSDATLTSNAIVYNGFINGTGTVVTFTNVDIVNGMAIVINEILL